MVVVGRVLGGGSIWVGIFILLVCLFLLFIILVINLLNDIFDICIFLFFYLDGGEDFCWDSFDFDDIWEENIFVSSFVWVELIRMFVIFEVWWLIVLYMINYRCDVL